MDLLKYKNAFALISLIDIEFTVEIRTDFRADAFILFDNKQYCLWPAS